MDAHQHHQNAGKVLGNEIISNGAGVLRAPRQFDHGVGEFTTGFDRLEPASLAATSRACSLETSPMAASRASTSARRCPKEPSVREILQIAHDSMRGGLSLTARQLAGMDALRAGFAQTAPLQSL